MTLPKAPLNDRLRYINEDGSLREDAVADAIRRKIARNYGVLDAHSVVRADVHGEYQIYQQRALIRALGTTTVADALALRADEHLRAAAEILGEDELRRRYDIAVGALVGSAPIAIAAE